MKLPFNVAYPRFEGYILEIDDAGVPYVISTKQTAAGRYLTRNVARNGFTLINTSGDREFLDGTMLRAMWGHLEKAAKQSTAVKVESKTNSAGLFDLINVDAGIEMENASMRNIVDYLCSEYGYTNPGDHEEIEQSFRIIPAGFGKISANVEVTVEVTLEIV